MNLMLFLGSGVSKASGHPDATKLTELILSADGYPKEVAFLKALSSYDDKARKISGTVTSSTTEPVGEIYRDAASYEDLYYLCEEIALFDWGLHNNAMTSSFIDSITEEFAGILESTTKTERLLEIGRLAHAAKRYLNKAVIENLKPTDKILGLDLLIRLALNPEVKSMDILTLNHDLLVEELFAKNNIPIEDGFTNYHGDVRWFEPDLYLSNEKVKLLKLHGSVDWFSFIIDKRDKVGKIKGKDPNSQADADGKPLQLSARLPNVLSGLNKIKYYNSGIYTDIHFHFQRLLYQHNLMVMSGYGWGDDSINTRLMTWLDKKKENRLVLLHEKPEFLMSRSLIFDRDHDNWQKAGKLKIITNWLSDTTMERLMEECL